MDTLSLVSTYLNGMEDILDDGDSLEARKLTVEKSKEELELFEALDHKSVIVNEGSHRVVVFKKAHPRAYSKPFTRFFLPCDVDGQGEPSVIFGRDFLVTSKSRVDFRIGKMRIDLTMLQEMKDVDVMLDAMVENLEEVEKVKEESDRKYKELEESKPILEVLENYMTYRKKLDEVLMGRARLIRDDYGEEVKIRIVEHGLPKKMCDQGSFVLPINMNGTIEMTALADTGESVSVLPYFIFMNLGLGDPKPYNSNLTMVDNTQDKAMEVYFNPFKNIIIFKILIDFLGSLSVQLKNTDWGKKGYGTYTKVEAMKLGVKNLRHLLMVGLWLWFDKIKFELRDNGDVFVDCSWERALFIYEGVYPEWSLEFFSAINFDKGVDRTKLMTEKCIWFRLYGVEKVLTLPEFVVLLGLYEEEELNHRKPASTNPRTSLIKEPLMRIMYKLLVRSLVHRASSKETFQKRDMWMMSTLEESYGINLAWLIADYLCKHAPGLKENGLICRGSPSFGGGHYGAHGDGYHAGSIVPSLGYEIGKSSTGFHGDDFDPIVHSEDCVESDDDEMQD
nr:hypothetical protein [Tanacetum cinerariifolium]